MGVLFDRTSDPQLFAQAAEEAQRIVRISGGAIAEEPVVSAQSPKSPTLNTASSRQENSPKDWGSSSRSSTTN
jgi:hypothetical protein